jgi:hypothetical protein
MELVSTSKMLLYPIIEEVAPLNAILEQYKIDLK